jgi:hypothetical protein
MPRFVAFFATFALVLAPPDGQEPRYVPIPFQGNFETFLKERLQAAKENEPLRDLLNRIRQDPKRYNFDPALLKQLDFDNPALAQALKGIMDKHPRGDKLSQSEVAGLKKALKEISALGKAAHIPSPQGPGNLPAPAHSQSLVKSPKPRSDAVDRWLRDLAEGAEDSRLGDWLRASPAFQRGLGDLKTLANLDKSPSLWGVDAAGIAHIPEHLRFSERLSLGLEEGILNGLPNVAMPDMPHVNLPHISLGSWHAPAVPLPNLGRPGGVPIGQALLWAAVVVALVILGWEIAKNLGPRGRFIPRSPTLGPWPVDPARVATRGQLIMAFDYLAVLLLGAEVRTWNHSAIARKIAVATDHAGAAVELALIYEQARYTTGPDPLSAADQAAARRHLCLLAGVRPLLRGHA